MRKSRIQLSFFEKTGIVCGKFLLKKREGRKDINTTCGKKMIIACARYNEIYIDLFLPDG